MKIVNVFLLFALLSLPWRVIAEQANSEPKVSWPEGWTVQHLTLPDAPETKPYMSGYRVRAFKLVNGTPEGVMELTCVKGSKQSYGLPQDLEQGMAYGKALYEKKGLKTNMSAPERASLGGLPAYSAVLTVTLPDNGPPMHVETWMAEGKTCNYNFNYVSRGEAAPGTPDVVAKTLQSLHLQ